jgi:hypothetical protein
VSKTFHATNTPAGVHPFMQHPDYVNRRLRPGVVNDMAVDPQRAVSLANVIAAWAEFRMASELADAVLKRVKIRSA